MNMKQRFWVENELGFTIENEATKNIKQRCLEVKQNEAFQ